MDAQHSITQSDGHQMPSVVAIAGLVLNNTAHAPFHAAAATDLHVEVVCSCNGTLNSNRDRLLAVVMAIFLCSMVCWCGEAFIIETSSANAV